MAITATHPRTMYDAKPTIRFSATPNAANVMPMAAPIHTPMRIAVAVAPVSTSKATGV